MDAPPCLLSCTGGLRQQQLVATNEATGAASRFGGCSALCTHLAHIVVVALIVLAFMLLAFIVLAFIALAFIWPTTHSPGLLCSCQARHRSKQQQQYQTPNR